MIYDEVMTQLDRSTREIVDGQSKPYAYALGYTQSMLARIISVHVPKSKHKKIIEQLKEEVETIQRATRT
jgi:hypothetical protein